MGVGHWRLDGEGFSTLRVHVDDLLESFEDYRDRAQKQFHDFLEAKRPDLLAAHTELTLGEAASLGLHDVIDDALSGEFHLWESEQDYVRDTTRQRYEDLAEGIQFALKGKANLVTDAYQLKNGERFAGDDSALLLAKGPRAQVMLRHWESSLYIGVAPSNALLEDARFLQNDHEPVLMRFLGACWSECDPKNEQFRRYANPDLVEFVKMSQYDKGVLYDGRVDHGALERVASKALALCVELQDAHDEDPTNAEAAERLQRFGRAFGVDTELLALKQDELEAHIEVVAMLDGTAEMVTDGYEKDYAEISRLVYDALAEMDEKPYAPDTAWTSRPVDLSSYRHAVVVQVGENEIDALLEEISISGATSDLPPHRFSAMSEHTFDRTVLGAVMARFPVEVDVPVGTVYLRAADDKSSGVLVWRGHSSWLGGLWKDKCGSEWLKNSASVPASDLPGWFALETDPHEIEATLNSLAAPQALMDTLRDSQGQLDVTGLLVETRDGDFGAVYATTSSRPFMVDTSYEPLMVNGDFRPMADVRPDAEVAP